MCKDSRILKKKCACGGKKIVPQTKKVSAMLDVPLNAATNLISVALELFSPLHMRLLFE